MKRLLIISFSDLENDPRVNRQIRYLSQYYHVSTVGLKPAGIDSIPFFQLNTVPRSKLDRLRHAVYYKLRRFETVYSQLYRFQPIREQLKSRAFHLILANDVESLPFAFQIAGDAPVICDAHEYSPGQFDQQWRWRFIYKPFNIYLCQHYLPRCRHVFTVGRGIADQYNRVFGVQPTVLTNATEYRELEPSPCNEKEIRIIHHGSAQPSRKIESMMEMMKYTDERFTLHLMLVPGDRRYLDQLKTSARNIPNVQFVSPVPMAQIPQTLNPYDIGFYILEPLNFNYRMSLPNKLFEFIQARLATAIGPSEEMARIVKQYDCGIVGQSFDPREMARRLNQLSRQQVMQFKQNAHTAAAQLTARNNMELLHKTIREIVES